MTPDCELLRQFARTNSEDAFAELVKRHVNLVYSAALRRVNGDEHLAKDVAQTVFTDLARKAHSLSRRENLSGWLYTSAHFAAAKIIRGETRRRDRETTFMRENINETASEGDWDKIRSALDEAMHELKQSDREAILLRYFENRPFAELGAMFGLNENAARMRVERALEKLHGIFVRHGIDSGRSRVCYFRECHSTGAGESWGDADGGFIGRRRNWNFHISKNYDCDQIKTGVQRHRRYRRGGGVCASTNSPK